jgi:hypothetical protein
LVCSWGAREALLEFLGVLLRCSWGALGAFWGGRSRSPWEGLGVLFGCFWVLLGSLGMLLEYLGVPLVPLGVLGSALGRLLGILGASRGAVVSYEFCSEAFLRVMSAHLGRSWGALGMLLGCSRNPWGGLGLLFECF